MHMARRKRPATTAHKPHCIPVALPRLESEPPLARRRDRVPRELLLRAWVASFAYRPLPAARVSLLFLFISCRMFSFFSLFFFYVSSSWILLTLRQVHLHAVFHFPIFSRTFSGPLTFTASCSPAPYRKFITFLSNLLVGGYAVFICMYIVRTGNRRRIYRWNNTER